MTNIIGIDLALNNTGIYSSTGKYKSIKVNSVDDIDRLLDIRREILFFIQDTVNIPNIVIIEGYAYNTNYAHKLGELGGVIKTMIRQNWKNCTIIIVTPSVLKKFITGKGNSDKSLILLNIYKKYGIEFYDHNIADAFVLVEIAKIFLKTTKTKKETELIKKLIIL